MLIVLSLDIPQLNYDLGDCKYPVLLLYFEIVRFAKKTNEKKPVNKIEILYFNFFNRFYYQYYIPGINLPASVRNPTATMTQITHSDNTGTTAF